MKNIVLFIIIFYLSIYIEKFEIKDVALDNLNDSYHKKFIPKYLLKKPRAKLSYKETKESNFRKRNIKD
jgi:hypothetical protein